MNTPEQLHAAGLKAALTAAERYAATHYQMTKGAGSSVPTVFGMVFTDLLEVAIPAYNHAAATDPDHLETTEEWSVEVPESYGSSEATFDTIENAVNAWNANQPALLKHTTTAYYLPASTRAQMEGITE